MREKKGWRVPGPGREGGDEGGLSVQLSWLAGERGTGLWGWLETVEAVSRRVVGYSCKSLCPLRDLTCLWFGGHYPTCPRDTPQRVHTDPPPYGPVPVLSVVVVR